MFRSTTNLLLVVLTLIIGKNRSINTAIGGLLNEVIDSEFHYINPDNQFCDKDIETISFASNIIVDLTTANGNSNLFIRQIRQLNQHAVLIALHIYHEPEFIHPLIQSGASGYLLLNTRKQELLSAIEAGKNGQTYISGMIPPKG